MGVSGSVADALLDFKKGRLELGSGPTVQSHFGLGVEVIIAGGMGPRARELFAERDIEAIIGASGPVDQVLEDYAAGKLVTGESACEHRPGDGHRCG